MAPPDHDRQPDAVEDVFAAIVPKPVEEELESAEEQLPEIPLEVPETPPEAAEVVDAIAVEGREAAAEFDEGSESSFNADLVAGLIDDETSAVEEDPALDPEKQRTLLDQISRIQRDLVAAYDRLTDEANREAPWYNDILVGAETTVAKADDLVDQLPKGDAVLDEARQQLLDPYFALTRLIDEREGRTAAQVAAAQIAAKRAATQDAREQVREPVTPQYATPGRKKRTYRVGALIALGVLVIGVRFAIGYYRDAQEAQKPEAQFGKDQTGVVAQNIGGKQTKDAVAEGAPVVSAVNLTQDRKGNVRAIVFAVNPAGPRPRLSYRWFRDGSELKTVTGKLVRAKDVRDGAAYKVEVTAHDRGLSSPPLMTKPLVVLRRTDGRR